MKRVDGTTSWDSVSEKFGVQEIYELECSDELWAFELLLCVYDPETKAYWFASDSGCSCPTPFDNHNDPADFEGPYDAATAAHRFLNEEFRGWEDDRRGSFYDARMSASLAVREHWEKLNADL